MLAAARSARRSATSPACFQHWDVIDRDWNPGGLWRPVRHRHHRPGAHRPLPRAVPRRQRHPRPPAAARPPRQRRAAARARRARRRRRRRSPSSDHSLARGHQRGRLEPRHRRPAAVVAVVAGRAAADRGDASRCPSTASRSDRRTRAHRAARGRAARTGCSRSTASGCSSRAPTWRRPRCELGDGHARRAAPRRRARARGRARPAPRPRPHRPSRAVRRRRRAGHAGVAGLPAARWVRPDACAGRPSSRPAPRSTCSATTRRSPCGARHDTPEDAAVLGQQLPSWNHTILDRWVKRAFEKADETRPVIAHSGVDAAPAAARRAPTATCTSAGSTATSATCPAWPRPMPRMVRFVSEFGVAVGARRRPTSSIRAVARPRLGRARASTTACDRDTMVRHVNPAEHATFDEWRGATQQYQATLLRHHIETLRRLKYRPTGGFCLSSLADPAPIDLDGDPRPRAPPEARLRQRHRCLPAGDRRGRTNGRAADGRRGRSPSTCTSSAICTARSKHVECAATLRWPGGSHQWRWQGDVPPDDCVRVGVVRFVVPDAPGSIWLDLALVYGDQAASNRYEAIIGETR